MNPPSEGGQEPWAKAYQEIGVGEDQEGVRLDVFLSRSLREKMSRSKIKKLIEKGSILVAGRKVSAHYPIKTGETIRVELKDDAETEMQAEAIPIEIIAEDDDVIVVNKPAGMVVHPAHGNPNHTLVNALLYHVRELSRMKAAVRPGLVHRLDRDTSGIMVIAKNEQVHGALARQFKNHKIEKVYQVVVRGVVQHEEGVCEEPVGRAFLNRKKVIIKPSGGKDAVTFFRVLKRFKKATLVEVRPKTGRTHQIRVHMAHLDHPVLGDLLYGVSSPWIGRQALHAFSLAFLHPSLGKRVYFEAPLPDDIKKLISRLESEA